MRKSQWGASYLGVFLGIIVFALVLKAAVAVAPVIGMIESSITRSTP